MSSNERLELLTFPPSSADNRNSITTTKRTTVVVERNSFRVVVDRDDLKIIQKDTDLASSRDATEATEDVSLVSSISDDYDLLDFTHKVKWWDGEKKYSDLIQNGIRYINERKTVTHHKNSIMLFESPSSCTSDSTFYNSGVYRFHDWPPLKTSREKAILGPCRYALMNGSSLPVFLREEFPEGLLEHWSDSVPGFQAPCVVHKITDDDTVYAYLPVEQIKNHVNDPNVHFHLVGKDAIHLMTKKTTKLLPNTHNVRPCIAKTTHSMGSRGIFVIRNDDDQAEFDEFLVESGNPTYVVTDFVDIQRNVACHFFMHPNGNVTWLGSNENLRKADGSFSSDSYLRMDDQEELKAMQLPYVEDVVQYCMSLGFWGFCGVDVLFDSERGYLVDVNPRVTGSCPALMTLQLLKEAYGFKFGLFRRGGAIDFVGTPSNLMAKVTAFNSENEGDCRIVVHSYYEIKPGKCRLNIGVYGNDMDECEVTLNKFAVGSQETAE